MSYLLDTNIRLRSIQPDHSHYERAVRAVETLLSKGETVCYCAQNVREFWGVCTRPAVHNGMGLTSAEVEAEIRCLESSLTFVPDDQQVYTEWRHLVEKHSVIGTQVHDTNLVALMRVSGITHLLTFNGAHFSRFSEIQVVEP